MPVNTKCCKYHDKIVLDLGEQLECGHSGMGAPIVCCRNCPDNVYPPDMAWYYGEQEDGNGRTFEIND